MTLCIMQGHLVLNKFSDCLNFWILFFKSGAVANRAYRAWVGLGGPKSG